MSDNNLPEDNGTQPAQSGSSSESSDLSIEKLNPEESDVAEIKPVEDDEKVHTSLMWGVFSNMFHSLNTFAAY